MRKRIVRVLVMLQLWPKYIWARFVLSENSPLLKSTKVIQPTVFNGSGEISSNGAKLGVWPSPYLLDRYGYIEARKVSAKVRIGKGTHISNNFSIIADENSIEIGDNCIIGPNVFIADSDFHAVTFEDRINNKYCGADIKIGDNVFIGEGVKILKGSAIGEWSVIACGAVVSGFLESYALYAGVPAKKVKSLRPLDE